MFTRTISQKVLAQARQTKRFISKDHLTFIKEVKKGQLEKPSNFQQTKHEKIGVGGYLLIAVPIGTFALGCWQVQRKQWKESLISNLESKMSKEPVPLPDK